MPVVSVKRSEPRARINLHGQIDGETMYDIIDKPFRNCTRKELAGWFGRVSTKIIALAGISYGIFGAPDILGDTHKRLSRQQRLEVVAEKSSHVYAMRDEQGKFELSYVEPDNFGVGNFDNSGNGPVAVAQDLLDTGIMDVEVGQSCLAGTDYDTRRDTNENQPAIVTVNGHVVKVTPTDRSMPDLEFAVDVEGNLLPSNDTQLELVKKGCLPGIHTFEVDGDTRTLIT